jgi:hypothetical protein
VKGSSAGYTPSTERVLAFIAGLKDSSTAGHTALSSSVHARRKREKKSAAKLRVSVFIVNGCKPFFYFLREEQHKKSRYPIL